MSDAEIHKSETLEHLGLVAGMFDELGIGELVDELAPQNLSQRKVSIGQALKANLVLNGLGFAKRRLEEVVDAFEELRPLAEGYRYMAFSTSYAEVEQRW